MITLLRLYSRTKLLDEVRFRTGINIILGKYEKDKQLDRNGRPLDLNGVGKSTLIRLIDFLLISDEGRNKYFSTEKTSFLAPHSVSLEFTDGDRKYEITRRFAEYSRVLFKENDIETEFRDDELRKKLDGMFFQSDSRTINTEGLSVRNLMRFFVKDDRTEEKRPDPFNFIDPHCSKYEVYAYNLFLLGLPNRNLYKLSQINKEIDHLDDQKKNLREKIERDTGSKIETLKSEIAILEEKISRLEKTTKEYRMESTYESIETDLIKISGEISNHLAQETSLQRRLAEIQSAYQISFDIDTAHIVRVYKQVKEEFGNQIKNKLEEVTSFRTRLTENRKKFLAEREDEINTELTGIAKKISILEDRRVSLYKLLDEQHALDSIKNTFTLYIEEKARKESLLGRLGAIREVEDELAEKQTQKSETSKSIYDEITKIDETIGHIRKIFIEIMDATVSSDSLTEATFEISAQADPGIPFKMMIHVPKSESQGRNRLALLAYDLTVFFNIIETNRRLPHFLVHDGALHGIAPRTVINLLNLINSRCLQRPNFQYIMTANESEVLFPNEKEELYGKYTFDIRNATIITLSEDPQGMLFKREYEA